MRVIITAHARKRLKELRQEDIAASDIHEVVAAIPGCIPIATRFRGFLSRSGKTFDLVIKDLPSGRLVITIIGK